MAGDYSFGSAMGGNDDPQSSSLSALLTYGANSDEESVGQPNSAPNVKSDASAPNASAAHVSGVTQGQPPTQASQAPIYNPPDTSGLTAAQGQLTKDMQPVTVKPKWWERLAGGLSAGAMAFGHVPGAVEAGQAVTNRGQIAADATQAKQVAADQSAIQAWQDGQKQQQQTFQNQNEAYRTKQEGVRTDLEASGQKQQQANSDRTFNRESKNDQFNQDRATKNDSWEHGFDLTKQNETARHNQADESISRGNLSLSQSRESRESKKQAKDDQLSGPEVQQQKAANAAQDKYRGLVQSIEDGDPKGSTPEAVQGFKATYRKAAASAVNPENDKPWASPEEKTAYLDELKQQNADRKNSVMESFAQDMNRLGQPTPVVTYDKEGRASTSNATPAQSGATPAQSAKPAASNYVSPTYKGNGLLKPGNVDLTNRPDIDNGDGSHSTVFSMGVNIDGKEMLIPGVGDGKTYPLRKLTTKEAIDQYKKTGNNLGTFKDAKSSDAYAETLHEDQEAMGSTGNLPKPPKPGTPLTDKAIAKQFLDANGGDPAKARAAAKQVGWKF